MQKQKQVRKFDLVGGLAIVSLLVIIVYEIISNNRFFEVTIIALIGVMFYLLFLFIEMRHIYEEKLEIRNPHTDFQTKYELYHQYERKPLEQYYTAYVNIENFQDIIDICGPSFSPMIESIIKSKLSEVVYLSSIYEVKETTYIIVSNRAIAFEDILERFNQPMRGHGDIDTYQLHIKVLSLSREVTKDKTLPELLTVYEYAMQETKKSKEQLHIIHGDMVERMNEENYYKSHLELAINNKQLQSYFQPKFDPKTKEIVGAEALSRWIENDRIISPLKYIYIAEATGLIYDIDLLSFENTCKFLQELKEKNLLKEGFKISTNLSPITLNNLHINDLLQYMDEYKIDSKNISVEITESTVIDFDQVHRILEEINQIGITIEVDDFSAGNSSFSVLPMLKATYIKIDQAVLPTLPFDQNELLIYEGLVGLIQTLNFKIVSEGVETPEQLDFVSKLHVDLVQGYIISKPVDKAMFLTLL